MSFLLNACVGIGFVHEKQREYNLFELGLKKGEISRKVNPEKITMESVKKAWGEPDKKTHTSMNSESWLYKRKTSFIGIVPMIGIGIPLIVPSGKNCTVLYFENDYAVTATYEHTSWSGFSCGYLDETGVNKGCAFLGN